MNTTQKIAALDALYATLPGIDCQRKCQSCCMTFGMTGLEKRRLARVDGPFKTTRTPTFTEHNILERGVLIGTYEVLKGTCRFLKEGACSVHVMRPMICRLWGLTKRTACPHGCQPERWLTDEEAYHFMRQASEISA